MIIADLSHWNFPSDATAADVELALTRAKAAGLGAVLWKCTEAATVVDDTYLWGQAICQKLGILFAGYHFFRHGDVPTQVNWFLSHANNPARFVLDFEDGEVLGAEMFVDRVQKATGRFPVVYTRQSYIYEKIGGNATFLSNCDLWVASYTNAAVIPKQWSSYALWQYTNAGKLDGFPRPVDLNRFNFALGDIATWWTKDMTNIPDVTQSETLQATNDIATWTPEGAFHHWAKAGETINVKVGSETTINGVPMLECPDDYFVSKANLVPVVTPPPIPPVTRYVAYKVGAGGTGLNIRKSNSASSDAIGSVKNGDTVTVLLPSVAGYDALATVNGVAATGWVLDSGLSVSPPR